jgi:hypothetical protein
MSYNLSFEIAPELYRRAVTTPMEGVPSKNRVALRNLAAAVLFPTSIFMFNRALFSPESLVPMLFAAALGGGLVLAVWWRQHRKLVGVHGRYNETGGAQAMKLAPEGIVAARPNIESHVGWAFVREIRRIEGATLIELPTARLIVPDAALPEGVTPEAFAADLEEWRVT